MISVKKIITWIRKELEMGERAAFIIEQGAMMKTANFQGVPYTFDQDCST